MARAKKQNGDKRERLRAAIDTLAALATVLLLVGVLAGAVFGVPALNRRVSERLAAPVNVAFDWPVAASASGGDTWLAAAFQQDLLRAAHDAAAANPDRLSPAQLQAVSEAVRRLGWFAGEPAVRRESAETIRVSGRWHVQAAVVRRGSRDLLIGWGGELLPFECPAGESGYPVIVGAAKDPLMDPRGRLRLGSVWPGEDVRAALELLALMQHQPWWGQVRGIDVRDFTRRGRGGWLVILTDRDTRVVWGARAGESAVERGEVRTETKLIHMSDLYRTTGRIDGGRREVAVNSEFVVVDDTAAGARR